MVRLSPLAKAGAVITMIGALMAAYGYYQDAPRVAQLSRGVVAVGVVLYFIARYRSPRR